MLKNKVILVTGASRGIGRATAILAGENGAKVLVNYNKSAKEAEEVVDLIIKKGGEATAVKADISNEKEVSAMFGEIKKSYGRLDVLVNNAGIMKNNLLEKASAEEFDEMVGINCKGAFFCSKYAAEIMKAQKSGKIM